MFATDFIFDSQRLSDFGCMICSFDGDFQTKPLQSENFLPNQEALE